MASILYYLPGHTRVSISRKDMEAAGLAHALKASGDPTCSRTACGPDAGEGAVAYFDDAGSDGYRKDEQRWRRSADGKFWLGYWLKSPPKPEDLMRDKVYDGQAVKLMDENEWIVPRCYAYISARPVTIPQLLDLDDAGRAVSRPHPKYEALCEKAYSVFTTFAMLAEGDDKMTGEQEIDAAIDALAVNYRVGRWEVIGLLRLWGTDEWRSVLRAMIDADEIEAVYESNEQKKSV